MREVSPPDWTHKPARRERRVDILRGVALFCIYIDHIPGDALNWVTLRNFGFSDAAELFVLLAGFASMMAYGRSLAREGARIGLGKIFRRCARLYVFQVGLLIATIGIVWFWDKHYQQNPSEVAPIVQGGVHAIVRGLTLRSQPSNLNILPLYIILLSVFPVIYAGMRAHFRLTLLASASIWLICNFYPGLNLINSFDGNGWFFDPYAWQFMFVLGAALAVVMARRDGVLPRWPWLVAISWGFLALSLLQSFPWTDWGLPDLAVFQMQTPDKTHLAALRLIHSVALVYVVLSWQGWTAGSGRSVTLRAMEICGKHSLEVFSLGTIMALVGKLVLATFEGGWLMQILINGVGFAGMFGIAWFLEGARKRPPPLAEPAQVVRP